MAGGTLLTTLVLAGAGLGLASAPAIAENGPAATVRAAAPHSAAPRAARPIVLRKLDVRMLLLWHYEGDRTRLRAVRDVHLPHDTLTAVNCLGSHCPKLPDVPIYRGSVHRLWRALERVEFRTGQRLVLSFTQPRRRAELIFLSFRRGRPPRVAIHNL